MIQAQEELLINLSDDNSNVKKFPKLHKGYTISKINDSFQPHHSPYKDLSKKFLRSESILDKKGKRQKSMDHIFTNSEFDRLNDGLVNDSNKNIRTNRDKNFNRKEKRGQTPDNKISSISKFSINKDLMSFSSDNNDN